MPYGVKIKGFNGNDMKAFAFLPKTRDAVINAAPADDVSAKFVINERAAALHPQRQDMVIEEVVARGDAKSYILAKKDGTPAAFFRAGQYLSLQFNFGESLVTRPYSICSSPALSKQGKYEVTIRKNPGGYAADKALETLKAGDVIAVSAPEGNFFYDPIRDGSTVIALAGGSGITPFLSMARAITDGLEDFSLVILYGSRTYDNILFRDELDEIAGSCAKVKVVHVLSDEEKEGCESGFITAEIIKKYMPAEGTCSVFICGPRAMYEFAEKETSKLGLAKKFIRKELQSVTNDVSSLPGYPQEAKGKTFTLKITRGEEKYEIPAKAEEPVLAAIERACIPAPSRCRCGECGWCRSKLLSGEVFTPEDTDYRRWADKANNYIHPCSCFPVSDLEIELPGTYI